MVKSLQKLNKILNKYRSYHDAHRGAIPDSVTGEKKTSTRTMLKTQNENLLGCGFVTAHTAHTQHTTNKLTNAEKAKSFFFLTFCC